MTFYFTIFESFANCIPSSGGTLHLYTQVSEQSNHWLQLFETLQRQISYHNLFLEPRLFKNQTSGDGAPGSLAFINGPVKPITVGLLSCWWYECSSS